MRTDAYELRGGERCKYIVYGCMDMDVCMEWNGQIDVKNEMYGWMVL